MTSRTVRRGSPLSVLSHLPVVVVIVSLAAGAEAQLRQVIGRAAAGPLYQVLQHRAGEDLGVGIDEVRVTSVAANSFQAQVCGSPPATPVGNLLEALASGPIGGARPIDLAYKSPVIADASPPCFAAAAADGVGAVCIGPACTPSCDCAAGGACARFTIADGTALDIATPDAPAAHIVAPMRLIGPYCNVSNHLTYSFGAANYLTTQAEICSGAPADGIRLPATPSAFTDGVAGTTIVLAYEAAVEESVSVAAAGFGVDADGDNPFSCDAPGRIVAAVQASDDEAPSNPPPTPPVDLSVDEQRCQQAIGRSSRRFTSRIVRALQACRERILNGSWQIAAANCREQPKVAKALRSAARLARSGIKMSCQQVDMRRLLTCGDQIDDLFTPDLDAGCLFETHFNAVEQTVSVAYGF